MATQQPEKQLRDFTLSVRLRPDMRERLAFVSDALGVSAATVASMAIGQFVAAQYASLNSSSRAIDSVIEKLGPEFMEFFKSTTDESDTCSSSKASSVQLPLLAADSTAKPAKSSPKGKFSKSKPSTSAGSSK